MAHLSHGMEWNYNGNRRNKQRRGNLDAFFRQWGQRGRPVIRSQYSSGLAMGAYRGTSISSAPYPSRDATCSLHVCLRALSICILVCGALMLGCGLFLYTGTFQLSLCIPGGLMMASVLLIWCILYVWHGTCNSSSRESCQDTNYRPATSGDEVTVEIPNSTPGEVMSSHGPDTRITETCLNNPPPRYSHMNVSGTFAVSGQSNERSPSTPPPPYNEVTF